MRRSRSKSTHKCIAYNNRCAQNFIKIGWDLAVRGPETCFWVKTEHGQAMLRLGRQLQNARVQTDILLVIVTPRIFKEDTRVMSEIHGGKLNWRLRFGCEIINSTHLTSNSRSTVELQSNIEAETQCCNRRLKRWAICGEVVSRVDGESTARENDHSLRR